MSKIRFEDVTITAKAIELDGIEDPSTFMRGLGLQDASVKETAQEDDAPPVVQVNEEPEVMEQEEVSTTVYNPSSAITADLFEGARRLRDVVQVFMDNKITDVDEIVDTCMALQGKVPILGRMSDIPGRMPLAIDMWLEKNPK